MIKTKHGTKVEIIGIHLPWISDGKRLKRVLVENIDERSGTCGNQDVMLEINLKETKKGEIEMAKEKVKKKGNR